MVWNWWLSRPFDWRQRRGDSALDRSPETPGEVALNLGYIENEDCDFDQVVGMDFNYRPPSTQWEPILLVPGSMLGIWVWCKPAHAPQDLIVRVPVEAITGCGGQLTLRQVLLAAGAEWAQVYGIATAAGFVEALGGASPLLDQFLPAVSPWTDLAVRMLTTSVPPSMPMQQPVASGLSGGSAYAIEADWTAVVQAETNLSALRKQLAAVQGKLQSLNRDLNADENIAADNLDKREWQDARRWLRDGAAQTSRYIKEADTGVTSMAGNKRRLEQLVDDAKAGRLSPQQLAQAQNEIESHRKTVVNIQTQMQNVLQSVSRDGEQRAQQILSRIAAKVRNHRSKR